MKNASRIKTVVVLLGLALLGAASVGQAQTSSAEGQPVHILVGKSVVLNLEGRIKRVVVSNSAVVEALGTAPSQVVLEAKAAGESNVILWDESGNSRMLDVTVDVDISGLRTALQRAYPNETLEIQADGGRVIVSGTVPNQHTADDIVKIAGAYSTQVVNSLDEVADHVRQVLLEVKIAEVDRTRLDQLGFNFISTGAGRTVGVTSTQQFGPISGSTTNGVQLTGPNATFGISNLLNVFLFRPDINLAAVIQDLEQNSVLQILAEPNLLALDGQKASFLAGGEFPFPVVQGGQNLGVVTIQFRPFGVKLDFTGLIGADNTVRLQVAPEVSTLDFTNAVTISGFTVPAISTRRAETEIELRDGQSFGIGGLLDQRVQAEMSKIPGIGDLPILGQLFRSKSVQRTRTELLVLVTPHVVDPVRAGVQAAAAPRPSMPFMEKRKFDESVPGHKELKEAPANSATPKSGQ